MLPTSTAPSLPVSLPLSTMTAASGSTSTTQHGTSTSTSTGWRPQSAYRVRIVSSRTNPIARRTPLSTLIPAPRTTITQRPIRYATVTAMPSAQRTAQHLQPQPRYLILSQKEARSQVTAPSVFTSLSNPGVMVPVRSSAMHQGHKRPRSEPSEATLSMSQEQHGAIPAKVPRPTLEPKKKLSFPPTFMTRQFESTEKRQGQWVCQHCNESFLFESTLENHKLLHLYQSPPLTESDRVKQTSQTSWPTISTPQTSREVIQRPPVLRFLETVEDIVASTSGHEGAATTSGITQSDVRFKIPLPIYKSAPRTSKSPAQKTLLSGALKEIRHEKVESSKCPTCNLEIPTRELSWHIHILREGRIIPGTVLPGYSPEPLPSVASSLATGVQLPTPHYVDFSALPNVDINTVIYQCYVDGCHQEFANSVELLKHQKNCCGATRALIEQFGLLDICPTRTPKT